MFLFHFLVPKPCRVETRRFGGNGPKNIFLHIYFDNFKIPSKSNKSWYNKNKEKFDFKMFFSDYFLDLNDFPWNDDATEREWVCSKVKQSYCDEESRNKIIFKT